MSYRAQDGQKMSEGRKKKKTLWAHLWTCTRFSSFLSLMRPGHDNSSTLFLGTHSSNNSKDVRGGPSLAWRKQQRDPPFAKKEEAYGHPKWRGKKYITSSSVGEGLATFRVYYSITQFSAFPPQTGQPLAKCQKQRGEKSRACI